MATQALPVQTPQWSLSPAPKVHSLPVRDVIEMTIIRLSQLVCLPEQSGSPTSLESKGSNAYILPVAFFPPRVDPVYIPTRDDVLRHPLFLKLAGEGQYAHAVFASDVNSRMFRGFLRTQVADRPFFDPRGPPEWTAEYSAVYEICHRMYIQKITEDGHSMLYRMRIRDKGEVAELRMLIESVIGKPSVYQHRVVRVFEEAMPFAETGFSPLPPSQPFCERPTRMPHRADCLCPRY